MKNPDSAAIYTMISKSNVKTTTRAKYFLLTLRSRTDSPKKKKKTPTTNDRLYFGFPNLLCKSFSFLRKFMYVIWKVVFLVWIVIHALQVHL